ncbi:MAG: hypothetical protein RL235_876, partial [Chlamydiota bacterium]
NNLCLAIWPTDPSHTHRWRSQALCHGVSGIAFQFLGPLSGQLTDQIKVNESISWHAFWPKDRGELPSLIRLIVHRGNEEKRFAFFLPQSNLVIEGTIPLWKGYI